MLMTSREKPSFEHLIFADVVYMFILLQHHSKSLVLLTASLLCLFFFQIPINSISGFHFLKTEHNRAVPV